MHLALTIISHTQPLTATFTNQASLGEYLSFIRQIVA
jgi:hypothetical protein